MSENWKNILMNSITAENPTKCIYIQSLCNYHTCTWTIIPGSVVDSVESYLYHTLAGFQTLLSCFSQLRHYLSFSLAIPLACPMFLYDKNNKVIANTHIYRLTK